MSVASVAKEYLVSRKIDGPCCISEVLLISQLSDQSHVENSKQEMYGRNE